MKGDYIFKRMYNGVDYRTGWALPPATGTYLPPKKSWWRRLYEYFNR